MNRNNLPPRRRTQSVGQPLHRIDPVEASTHSSRRSWDSGSPTSMATPTPDPNPYYTHASHSSPPSQTSSSTNRFPYDSSNQESNYPTHVTYPRHQGYRAHFSPRNPHRDPTYQYTPDHASPTAHSAHRQSIIPISFLINPTPESPQSSSPPVFLPSPQDSTSSSPSYPNATRSFRHLDTYTDDSRVQGYPHVTLGHSQRLPRLHSSPAFDPQPESYSRHRFTERESLPTPPYSRPHDRQTSSTPTHYRRRSQESHYYQHQQTYPQPHDYRQSYPYPPVPHSPLTRHDDRPVPSSRPTSLQHLQFGPTRLEAPVHHPYPNHSQGFELLAAASNIERHLKREAPETKTPIPRTKSETPARETELLGRKEVVLEEDEEEEQGDHGGEDEEEEEAEESNDWGKEKTTRPRQVSIRRTNNPDLKTTKTGKIQHKPKRVGINKRSTAYNRFLQQQSKYLAKFQSHLTPQQRMKRIAEEWAVSEKNPHKTRRKSRFLGPNGELLLPLSTSSSPQPPIQPQDQATQDQAAHEQAGPSATEPADISRP